LYGERLGIILMATSERLARNPVKEEEMRRSKLFGAVILVVLAASMVLAVGCSSKSSSSSSSGTVEKPQPKVESVVATTSGTQSAYYTTLDIKVKNNGADGLIIVKASVTQGEKTNQLDASFFLKKGGEYELPLTFPLVWGGGEFTYSAETSLP
jgi:hypothetical protein